MSPLEAFVTGFLHAIHVAPVVFVLTDRGGTTVYHPPMPNAQGPILLMKGIEMHFKTTMVGQVKLAEESPEYIRGRRDGAVTQISSR